MRIFRSFSSLIATVAVLTLRGVRRTAVVRCSRPPVKRTVVSGASKGSREGRRSTNVSLGAVTRTMNLPGPVTDTQPSPAITTSYWLFFQLSPEIYVDKNSTRECTCMSLVTVLAYTKVAFHTITQHEHSS